MTKKTSAPRYRMVSEEELGYSRRSLINAFHFSKDPYLSAHFKFPVEPAKAYIKKQRELTGQHITMTHLMIKVMAVISTKMPYLNCVIFNGKVYEIQDINVTSVFKIPDSNNALTTIISDAPHEKSLGQICEEFNAEKTRIINEFNDKDTTRQLNLSKLLIRSRLFKVLGEKRTFELLYKKRLISQIGITNIAFGSANKFIITRFAMQFMRSIHRIGIHGPAKEPRIVDGQLVEFEYIPILVMFDHRLFDGFDLQQFAEWLEKISEDLDGYLG